MTFGHHQDDQEAQECPPSGGLEDFGYLDGDFVTQTPHMIPFWNPQNHGNTLEVISGHQDDQEAQKCPKNGNLENFRCFGGDVVTVTPHMIPFWNPQDHGSSKEVYLELLVTIRMMRKHKNVLHVVIQRILCVLMGILSL